MTTLRDPFDLTYEKDGFTYVSWSQVADRLDEVTGDWSFDVVQFGEDKDGPWCLGRLQFDGRSFQNVGYAEHAEAEWKHEALKDAVSDALKRCAAMAGVARYLYDKDPPTASSTGQRVSSAPRPALPAVGVPPLGASAAGEPRWPGETAPQALPVTDMGSCPDHHKPFRDGKYGWFCSSKLDDGSWCKRKPRVAA